MPLSSEDLHQVAARTLAHYEHHAQSYWEGMRDHDVSQNIAALLKHTPGQPPFDLLDFGCGPGRDLHTFKALGHRAVGLEGAPSAAALARVHSGCEVPEQSFLHSTCPRSATTVCLSMPCCSMFPTRCCRRCCDNCRPACGRAECCSAATRAAMARKAGTVSATAYLTTGQPGALW